MDALNRQNILDFITNADMGFLNRVQELISTYKEEKSDFWTKLSQEEKDEIDKGLAQAEAGNTISHEEVMQQRREKYGKKYSF